MTFCDILSAIHFLIDDMSSNIIVHGYKYDDLQLTIPVEKETELPPEGLSGLKLRDYALSGGELHVFLGEQNNVGAGAGHWYATKSVLLPSEEQTPRNIGTLKLKQFNEKDEAISEQEFTLDDLDNGHILDRIFGTVLETHARSFGDGPFTQRVRTPQP